MGFNTSILLLNDSLHALPQEKDLGEKLRAATLHLSVQKGPIDISVGGHVNAMSVIETHHADRIVPVLFGGNLGRVIESCSHPYASKDPEMELLMMLSYKKGYSLRKRPVKR